MEKGPQENLLTEIYDLLAQDTNLSVIELIEEKKKEFGISSDRQLSEIIKVDRNSLKRLLEGEVKKVDVFSLLKINQFLGLGIDKLIQVYVSSMKPEAVKELEEVRKANFIVRNFDIQALKKEGFIQSITDFNEIENRIKSFFKLRSIFDYQSEVGLPLFSQTKNNFDDKMKDFWVRCAFYQFKKIDNPNEYDSKALKELVPKIRAYTRFEDEGFITVARALYNVGVTVIVQSYLSKTQVRGATFAVNSKPCIVITDYRKSYDTIWFSLLHELYHALYDLDKIKKLKFHLTGEQNLFLMNEEDADFFAREILFPENKMKQIRPFINAPNIVEEFARKSKVHPSIIYGFHCWNEKLAGNDVYKFYAKFIPKSEAALKTLRTYPLEKETIDQEAAEIQKILTGI